MPDRSEAIKLIRQAYDLGCTFFDTAEGYGMGSNEELMGCSSNTVGNIHRGNAINTSPPSIAFSMTRRIRRT